NFPIRSDNTCTLIIFDIHGTLRRWHYGDCKGNREQPSDGLSARVSNKNCSSPKIARATRSSTGMEPRIQHRCLSEGLRSGPFTISVSKLYQVTFSVPISCSNRVCCGQYTRRLSVMFFRALFSCSLFVLMFVLISLPFVLMPMLVMLV